MPPIPDFDSDFTGNTGGRRSALDGDRDGGS
jgi:hypothetical protein